jgi:hypothetical protein
MREMINNAIAKGQTHIHFTEINLVHSNIRELLTIIRPLNLKFFFDLRLNITGNEEAIELAAVLRDPDCTILAFEHFHWHRIGHEGVKALQAAIKHNYTLIYCDFSNTWDDESLMPLMVFLGFKNSLDNNLKRNIALFVWRCDKILQECILPPKVEELVLNQCKSILKMSGYLAYMNLDLNKLNQVIEKIEKKAIKFYCSISLPTLPNIMRELVADYAISGIKGDDTSNSLDCSHYSRSSLYYYYFSYNRFLTFLSRYAMQTISLLCSSLPMLYYSPPIVSIAFITAFASFGVLATYNPQYTGQKIHSFYESIEDSFCNDYKLLNMPLLTTLLLTPTICSFIMAPAAYFMLGMYTSAAFALSTIIMYCPPAIDVMSNNIKCIIDRFEFVNMHKPQVPFAEGMTI